MSDEDREPDEEVHAEPPAAEDGAAGSGEAHEATESATEEEPTGSAAEEAPGETPAAAAGVAATGWTPAWLADLRADEDKQRAALVAAALAGVGTAMVHWLGLFVAGALVGLVSRTLPRAVVAGFGVGLLVLGVHVGGSPVMGAGEFLALTPAAYLAVAAALVAPVWGSLVRGVL